MLTKLQAYNYTAQCHLKVFRMARLARGTLQFNTR